MPEYFGKSFENLRQEFYNDLQDLEQDGCLYTQFWNEDLGKFAFCRIQFEPSEIVKYVDSLKGYDEFLGYRNEGYEEDEAVELISDDRVKRTAKDYAQWVRDNHHSQAPYCAAAFYLDHLESLVCGTMDDRYEFLQETYSGDRRFLLEEIFEGFESSISILEGRRGDRPDFEIDCETDVQDLLFAILKPIFPDARPEEYTPQNATDSKRIDCVIPDISTVIEIKYVRDSSHANDVADELRIDIESYHAHEHCQRMYCIVWDADSEIDDVENFESDLTGPRTIDGNEVQVETKVLP